MSLIALTALSGSPTVRTANVGVGTRVCRCGTYIVGRRLVAHAVVFGVAQHTDDFELAVGFDARSKTLADRVLIRKVFARGRVVDDHDLWRRGIVFAVGEASSEQERHTHQLEEVGRNNQPVDAVALVLRVCSTLDENARLIHAAGQQPGVREPNSADAANGHQPIHHLLV